ncbi:2-hydroxyacyl-CoA dehydratase family protein [Pseudobacteroides cellulosolvens]|uniref:2-hydroxyglutaryl-CoA dehydratase D-component n=1 Tax=Pseudobacteroides cellulosolvens ATCC 35603 = DSM 2933 TaxID=398512 RepID=A0A0L6JR14_9FIRM|nr:2-hydroxyacyl-CoA dehydratase family protein [Pseudobacteroides cellulosolvens]KNY28145.1 2-hydroxyglutaryl-CoA dehydratase D-component [Pseudobacteroides cellulosolvens ATCC 35603 = DSM 2933]
MQETTAAKNQEELKNQRRNERIVRNMQHVSNKYLRRIYEIPIVPQSLEYFSNILKRIFVENKSVERDNGVKLIGTYCVMVPQELIYAAGCIPVKLCSGSYTAYNIGDEFTPRDACPLVKSSIGFASMNLVPIYDECSMVIVPTSCDCKKKMVSILAKYNDNVIPLHVPTIKLDDELKNSYIEDIYALKKAIESISPKKISYSRLKAATEAIAVAQREIYRLYSLKMHSPSVIKGTHAMIAMNSYSYDRIDRWAKALRILNDELELRIESKRYVAKPNAPRIMVTGSPVVFPNIKIPLLIEEMGGIFVADETCMGERGLYDPVAVTENSLDGLIRALAIKAILPCSCPSFVNNDQRIFKLKQMIEDFKVQGVIYHVLRGCLVYDYEYFAVEDALRSMDIPIIRVETDYNEEDVEQLRIRIEAFVELIKFKNMED